MLVPLRNTPLWRSVSDNYGLTADWTFAASARPPSGANDARINIAGVVCRPPVLSSVASGRRDIRYRMDATVRSCRRRSASNKLHTGGGGGGIESILIDGFSVPSGAASRPPPRTPLRNDVARAIFARSAGARCLIASAGSTRRDAGGPRPITMHPKSSPGNVKFTRNWMRYRKITRSGVFSTILNCGRGCQ